MLFAIYIKPLRDKIDVEILTIVCNEDVRKVNLQSVYRLLIPITLTNFWMVNLMSL